MAASQITRVVTHPLHAALPDPQRTSQATYSSIEIVVVEVHTGDGLVGWGECLCAIDTERYEAGWAIEAIFFLRVLAFRPGAGAAWSPNPQGSADSTPSAVPVRVQVSADGMRWIDEGSTVEMPRSADQDTFVRVRHFGDWLRLAGHLPDGLAVKALVTIHLK